MYGRICIGYMQILPHDIYAYIIYIFIYIGFPGGPGTSSSDTDGM